MELEDVSAHIVKEINRNLEIIQTAKSEKYDEWAKEKVKALVDVLDLVDEVKDTGELVTHVQRVFRGAQGTLDGLNDLLQALGAKK